jgi:Ca2+-binding RTX toxin-like protein
MNGGDDRFPGQNGVSFLHLTVDGGADSDTILGGDGDDVLIGGTGQDFIDGNRGNGVAQMGSGMIRSCGTGRWQRHRRGPGRQRYVVVQRLNIGEKFDLSANGTRLRLTRDVAGITMDVNDVEKVTVNVVGGADVTTVNDLSGTGVTDVTLNEAANDGTPDLSLDAVIVQGTANNDSVKVSPAAGGVKVTGLATSVTITGADSTDTLTDTLTVNGLAGDDVLDASAVPAGVLSITLDGGANDDLLIGSAGADTLRGGDGDDILLGGPGVDVLDAAPAATSLSGLSNEPRAIHGRGIDTPPASSQRSRPRPASIRRD